MYSAIALDCCETLLFILQETVNPMMAIVTATAMQKLIRILCLMVFMVRRPPAAPKSCSD